MSITEQLIADLPSISSIAAEKLRQQRLVRSLDLLFVLPLHYHDKSRITAIADLQYGKKAMIEGRINSASVSFGKRRVLSCIISDKSGSIALRFFYFNRQQQASLTTGKTIRCFGEPRGGKSGLEIYHPKYNLIDPDQKLHLAESLLPIYPKIDGLGPTKLAKLIEDLFKNITTEQLDDPLYTNGLETIKLIDALAFVHNPPVDASLNQLENKQHPMQLRLVRDELVAQRLSFLQKRKNHQLGTALACIRKTDTLRKQLLDSLTFTPTQDQLRVEQEILKDIASNRPMLRLLQGDVGSGKTLVALLATLPVFEQGWQCVLMAPTELLAEQHYQQFTRLLHPLHIEVAFLSSKMSVAQKRQSLQYAASGQAQIILGTHAIIQQAVRFKALALAIIDEQHRFGVHQRIALRNKSGSCNNTAHQLIMTATPIPRTLAMSHYADLDLSVIRKLPPGRKRIKTILMSNDKRDNLLERVQTYCDQGNQVYWVCPLIEDSETINCESAERCYALLCQRFAELEVGLLHGRLDNASKQQTMHRFREGEIQLLVATTVIEVGVDVPNASLMVVENAERLGLAQLHQLRGRVGRGGRQSYCILLYGQNTSALAAKRLKIMHQHQSGFDLAEQDLQLRGPGEMLGAKQAGSLQLRIANIQDHQAQFERVSEQAKVIIVNDDSTKIMLDRWFPNHNQYLSA